MLSMLGMCRKAGKLVQGYDAVTEAAGKKQLFLMATTSDVSPRTLREIEHTAGKTNIPLYKLPATIGEIGEKTGKATAVLGVADPGLARVIEELIRRANEEEREL